MLLNNFIELIIAMVFSLNIGYTIYTARNSHTLSALYINCIVVMATEASMFSMLVIIYYTKLSFYFLLKVRVGKSVYFFSCIRFANHAP